MITISDEGDPGAHVQGDDATRLVQAAKLLAFPDSLAAHLETQPG